MPAVLFTLAARKALRLAPRSARADIDAVIAACGGDKDGPGSGHTLGQGPIRVGAYRLIARVCGDSVEVVRAGHRKDVYR